MRKILSMEQITRASNCDRRNHSLKQNRAFTHLDIAVVGNQDD